MICLICNTEVSSVVSHCAEAHGITPAEYYRTTNADPYSPEDRDSLRKVTSSKQEAVKLDGLKVPIGGFNFDYHPEVPASAALPMPGKYRLPTKGDLASQISNVLMSLAFGRSVYVYGPPGTGKDAIFSWWSAYTRKPGLLVAINPNMDVSSLLFTRGFEKDGTCWEEGEVLRFLRDGYVTPSGNRIPGILVLSDIDRATPSQAEVLRMILDSTEGRIPGPNGKLYPVLPGTIIVATANSSGAGDITGRCVSSRPLDSSILDRFNRKFRFSRMSEEDESVILRDKFGGLSNKFPNLIGKIVKASNLIRSAVESGQISMEFSHRSTHNWVEMCEDLCKSFPRMSETELLSRSVATVYGSTPDPETASAVKTIIATLVPNL